MPLPCFGTGLRSIPHGLGSTPFDQPAPKTVRGHCSIWLFLFAAMMVIAFASAASVRLVVSSGAFPAQQLLLPQAGNPGHDMTGYFSVLEGGPPMAAGMAVSGGPSIWPAIMGLLAFQTTGRAQPPDSLAYS